MTREQLEELNARVAKSMEDYVSELAAFTAPLGTVDSITVTASVTSADVAKYPADYYLGSVNQTKYVATFVNESDAKAALNSGDYSKARTLSQFKYPKTGQKIVIDLI